MEEAIIKSCPWHNLHSKAIVRLLYDDKAQQVLHLKGCIIYSNFRSGPLVFAKKCANKSSEIGFKTSITSGQVFVTKLDDFSFDPN